MDKTPAVLTVPAESLGLQDEKRKMLRMERITELEDRVYDIASGVVEATLSFHEVDPDQAVPPEEWVQRYGQKAAEQRLAVAKAGWMPQNIAPSAVKLAATVMNGITRGRNYNKQRSLQQINVKIALPAPTSQEHPGLEVYPTREIE